MYTLLNLYTPRSIGSRLYGRGLISVYHGPVQRLFNQPYVRSSRFQTTRLFADTTSLGTAQPEAEKDDPDQIWQAFETLEPFLQEVHRPQSKTRETRSAREMFFEYWKTPKTAKPTDLSYWNVVGNELKGRFPEASVLTLHAYRAHSNHSPDRALTMLFIFKYFDQVCSAQGLTDEAASSLSTLIDVEEPSEACERIIDLFHNSWVLLAEPCDLVQRYIALAKHREASNLSPSPLWLLLQILRIESIDRASLMDLVEWLSPRLGLYDWKGSSAMILGIRLARHVRRVRAPDFEAVAALFVTALKLRFKEARHHDILTLTHWCNRFLTLMAMPAVAYPFEAVRSQQGAQLDVLQFMQDFQPEIHLSREGYRALARLQTMHAKTPAERQWAEAKALTWPPWEERNRMGAALAPVHYDGKETRALQVLNRMVESGYAPHMTEARLKILTGWDTDNSPTIQSRRVSPSVPRAYESGPELDETIAHPEIWSSRIEATRTVREAWMVFCTYISHSQAKEEGQQHVYHAMHRKLIAPKALPDSGLLPGDGPEVFPDPDFVRDQVYIPEQIPMPSELVSRMIHNKIACNETVLAYFLDRETVLDTGLALLQNSFLDLDIKAVLVDPHRASFADMAKALDNLKTTQLRSAYVKLLSRPNTLKSQDLQMFRSSVKVDAPTFVWHCLRRTELDRARSMAAYLAGLAAHLSANPQHIHRLHSTRALQMMQDTIEEYQQTMTPSFAIVKIAASTALRYAFPVERVKQLFIAAACGSSRDRSVITWSEFCKTWDRNLRRQLLTSDVIEYMVWLLGSQYWTTDLSTARGEIFLFLELIYVCRQQLSRAGIVFTKSNLAAFRLFLELDWLRQGFENHHGWETFSWESSQEVHCMLYALAQEGPYPDDEFMLQYLTGNSSKRRWIEMKIRTVNGQSRTQKAG